MRLYLDGHDMGYEMGNLCFLFFPGEKLETTGAGKIEDGPFVYTRLRRHRTKTAAFVMIGREGRIARAVAYAPFEAYGSKKQCEYALGRAFYKAAAEICGFRPPWGILTGIRPARIAREMQSEGLTPGEVESRFIREYYVQPQKASLCVQVSELENQIIRMSRPESVSLYISIPFCPTRCLYCSFISHDVDKMARLLPRYVELLCEEIRVTAEIVKKLGLKLETIYMGGGTPTSLSAGLLERIFKTVRESFTMNGLREYTVEAGRPDTITREKLEAIKEGGAGRICINPQTLDDEILKNIGRNHTAAQVYNAFALARRTGLPNINMDLIAGLPGDTPDGFERTLRGILEMSPEGVTIHTLAMKRSSRLVTSGNAPFDPRGESADRMLETASVMLQGAGMRPYYLYRQRNTTGNLENTGFSLPGREGLYNVFIMDETHTVLAVGAGGVTKLRQPMGSRIERVFNFKYPYEYISRFNQIIDRKKQVEEFYVTYDWKNKNFQN